MHLVLKCFSLSCVQIKMPCWDTSSESSLIAEKKKKKDFLKHLK